MTFSPFKLPVSDTLDKNDQSYNPVQTSLSPAPGSTASFNPDALRSLFNNSLSNFSTNFSSNLNTGLNQSLDNKFKELNLGGIDSRLAQVNSRLGAIDSRVGDTLTREDLRSTTSDIQGLSNQIGNVSSQVDSSNIQNQRAVGDVLSSLGNLNLNVNSGLSAIQQQQDNQSSDLSDKIAKIDLNLDPVLQQQRATNQAVAGNTAAITHMPDQIKGNLVTTINDGLEGQTQAIDRRLDQTGQGIERDFRATQQLIDGSNENLQNRLNDTAASILGRQQTLQDHFAQNRANLDAFKAATGAGFQHLGDQTSSAIRNINSSTAAGLSDLESGLNTGFQNTAASLGDIQNTLANLPVATATPPAASSNPNQVATPGPNQAYDFQGYFQANNLDRFYDRAVETATPFFIERGWDKNSDGAISPEEYAQFHWDWHGSSGNRNTFTPPAIIDTAPPTPDTPPVPDTPAGPTPEELLANAIQSRYGNLFNEGGFLHDAQGSRDVYDMVRAADARAASNPFDINEVFSTRNRAEEELRGLDAFQRQLANEYGADTLAAEQGNLDAMRTNLQSILDQANARVSDYSAEGQRLDTEAATIATEAADLLQRMQSSTDIRNPYGPNGIETLRSQFSALMARAQNQNSYAADGSRFSGALGLQGQFDEAYNTLNDRRTAALSDIGSELDAISSGVTDLRGFDAQGLADLEARLNAARGDVNAFGAQGTADLAARVDQVRDQITGFGSALTGRRREFEDQAMSLAQGSIGQTFDSQEDLQAAQDQLDLLRLNADRYGASGASGAIGFYQTRLNREAARLRQEADEAAAIAAQDAANVEAREAAARAARQAELAEQRAAASAPPASGPFAGVALPNSQAFNSMTPDQYLRLLMNMNAARGTQFHDARPATPSAFSAALANMGG